MLLWSVRRRIWSCTRRCCPSTRTGSIPARSGPRQKRQSHPSVTGGSAHMPVPISVLTERSNLLPRALTSTKRPAPIDITWGSTRLSCAPPRAAVSRLPIAFWRPEPCRRSSGAFDPRRVLRTGRPLVRHGCALGSTRAPSGLDSP
jgi:hypothetical protein